MLVTEKQKISNEKEFLGKFLQKFATPEFKDVGSNNATNEPASTPQENCFHLYQCKTTKRLPKDEYEQLTEAYASDLISKLTSESRPEQHSIEMRIDKRTFEVHRGGRLELADSASNDQDYDFKEGGLTPPPKKLKDFEVLEIIYYSFGIPHTSFIQLDDIVSVELGTESECIDFDHEERKHFSPKNRHYAFTIATEEWEWTNAPRQSEAVTHDKDHLLSSQSEYPPACC